MPSAWMPPFMRNGIRQKLNNPLLGLLSSSSTRRRRSSVSRTSTSRDFNYELLGHNEGELEEIPIVSPRYHRKSGSRSFRDSKSMVRHARRPSTSAEDDAQLRHLGHKQELNRNFSLFSMLGLGFAILNSWTALAASLSLALPSGGSTAILWGLVTAGICNLCLSSSLAEFLSAYPTAAGQYHWVAVVSPPKWMPILAWTCGWVSTFGWMALTATAGTLGSQLVVGIISMENPHYEPERWHQFLVYVLFTAIAFVINAFMGSLLPHVTKASLIWSIGGFAIISITLLACSSGNYSSAEFVFKDFTNETGWPDGIAWLLGLLQAALGLTGFDGVAHCIEEIPHPSREGPKVMIGSVIIGIVTGFIFLTVLLFCLTDVATVIASPSGPLLEIFYQSTGSRAGAICLLIFPVICLLFAGISIMTTSSRMIYAFARDGGLPASRVFAKVHDRLEVPLNGLLLTCAGVIIFGLIFLGSSSALNAILSASVVALGVSYGFPVAINVLRGRKMLPESREFKLSNTVGWIANIIGLIFVSITTVLFVFPPALPVDGNNMNYCIVAFFVVIVISTVQWFVDGKKNFNGPRVNLDDLAAGNLMVGGEAATPVVAGVDPTTTQRVKSQRRKVDGSGSEKSDDGVSD